MSACSFVEEERRESEGEKYEKGRKESESSRLPPPLPPSVCPLTHLIVNHPNKQTTTRTFRNILSFLEVEFGDLKSISTGARVVVDSLESVPDKVFDFHLRRTSGAKGRVQSAKAAEANRERGRKRKRHGRTSS